MNILVLSFYYPPDLCAGSFRTVAFVESLSEKVNAADCIDVITTQPNRYHSYNVDVNTDLRCPPNVSINRLKIPSHRSGTLDQSISFGVFFYKTLKLVKNKHYDAIFATSSRLFTAFMGMIISRRKKIPLYLDIRDIFVDTLQSLFVNSPKRILLPGIKIIEQITMNHAQKINLVSAGFESYFRLRYPGKPLSFYSNGIDQEFLDFDFGPSGVNTKPVVTYAGNIGEGQGLEKIIPSMAKAYPELHYVVIGDGGAKSVLLEAVKGIVNVEILPPVSREELLHIYHKSDYLLLHLNDCPAFRKVLPSKIFEYGATGKPIIAGVAGYAKEFLGKNLPGCIVFEPGNVDDLLSRFSPTDLLMNRRSKEFMAQFSRSEIMHRLADDFLETIQ